ncbi:hypothetical protein GCM10023189_15880 [Nibrella saemangeumensis]|uniref:Uncharacterized protein n=1 Tax=Nibrella saemangeumensis TaxID=1084526 RepID=A0ABP8MLF4_9BACT
MPNGNYCVYALQRRREVEEFVRKWTERVRGRTMCQRGQEALWELNDAPDNGSIFSLYKLVVSE